MAKTKEELKSCPFCGGKVKQSIKFNLYFFNCYKCGAMISFDCDECNHQPAKAIDKFNGRYNERS